MEEFKSSNPNLFFDELVKKLPQVTAEMQKSVEALQETVGIEKQYRFTFKGKTGIKKKGIVLVMKGFRSMSVELEDMNEEDIQDILELISKKESENG